MQRARKEADKAAGRLADEEKKEEEPEAPATPEIVVPPAPTDDEVEEWTAEGEARGMKATVVVGNSTRAIANTFNVTLEVVNQVLEVLQRCEPIGVASRDLRECLLTQAMLEHPDEPKLHRLIDRHLGNLEKRKRWQKP